MIQIKVNYEYEILLLLLKQEMHGRELAKLLKTSLTRIQLALIDLRKSNILDYKISGKNHIYFIKKNLVSKAFILNAENYRLAKLICKYPVLEPLFKEISQKYNGQMIILFGSYAKFISKDGSDIDIYLDSTDNKVKDKINGINSQISVKIGEFNKEDLLIQEIIKNHIIIRGGESFYEKLGFFK